MRAHLRDQEIESRRRALSIRGVAVRVEAEVAPCPQCGGSTQVQKSTPHQIVTLEHGAFVARETVRVCARRCTHPSGRLVTQRSAALSRSVARGAIYGYDLEVHIGLERFLRHRQRLEIQGELDARFGIALSTGQISLLAARFLQHLERLHRSQRQALRNVLASDGNYPLHFDATGEDGRGTLFLAYAGWRNWVLGSWKLTTERADQILPRLREVVQDFGRPCALVRDLGRAAISAGADLVRELGGDIRVLSCHQHFLRDVGEDLLEADHDELRELVRRFKLRPHLRSLARNLGRQLGAQLPALRVDIEQWAEGATDHALPAGSAGLAVVRSLAQWAMDYGQDSQYRSFPFDQPYLDLVERCRKIRRAVDAFLRRPPSQAKVRRPLERLARILDPVVSEGSFATVAARLSARASLFDELRDALRLPTRGPSGRTAEGDGEPPPQDTAAELRDIRRALDELTDALHQRRPERGPAQDTREAIDLVLDHLKRHGDSLWGHVITLPAGDTRVVARTNNILEGFFHQMKHGERRRSGRKILTHDFECLPAAAALAYNLTRADYVQVVCGSLDEMPSRFAQLDQSRTELRALSTAGGSDDGIAPQVASASLPQQDRAVVRALSLRRRIEAAAKSRAPQHAVAGVWDS